MTRSDTIFPHIGCSRNHLASLKSMKNLLVALILLNIGHGAKAQRTPFALKFSHQIESGIADGSIRPTRAGTLYSFIGEYYNASSYSDIPISWGLDSVRVDDYTIMEALPYIVDRAKDHQIVIISENHLRPQHRIFAKWLLGKLGQQGFRHLGVETFIHLNNSTVLFDSNLVNRGYPLDSPVTGTYTMEPKMGDLVRRALTLGYVPFAYEASAKVAGKDRDEVQADNIIKYLLTNPGARIVIVCGFHHAIESEVIKRRSSYWMAKYLKDKTGIDPLTIYQDNFTEKFVMNEHPCLTELDISLPSIFTDGEGEVIRFSDQVDIEIVHPITRYRNGRPAWMYENDDFNPVPIKIDRDKTKFPVIVSAYKKGEEDGVPIDRMEIKYKYDHKVLVLDKGEYLVRIFDGTSYDDYLETVR